VELLVVVVVVVVVVLVVLEQAPMRGVMLKNIISLVIISSKGKVMSKSCVTERE